MAEVMTQDERNVLSELLEAILKVPEENLQFLLGYATAINNAGLRPEKGEH